MVGCYHPYHPSALRKWLIITGVAYIHTLSPSFFILTLPYHCHSHPPTHTHTHTLYLRQSPSGRCLRRNRSSFVSRRGDHERVCLSALHMNNLQTPKVSSVRFSSTCCLKHYTFTRLNYCWLVRVSIVTEVAVTENFGGKAAKVLATCLSNG